ncbi:MAG: type II toxin-antitoxin system mRNA interferase toxin, RelE/StbE family [Acidobacteria bacterium]|nr:MAG: type II toxin-antitoxin system mRNA interferase toxin, RelE/StbE family [Acidobacteriota bacterium]
MAKYKILIKPSAVKEIEAIPRKDRLRIIKKILALENTPRPSGCEKLCSQEKYRIREGPYRIVFSIDDGDLSVLIVKVGHRREVYR